MILENIFCKRRRRDVTKMIQKYTFLRGMKILIGTFDIKVDLIFVRIRINSSQTERITRGFTGHLVDS